jgi:hypothetical protein
MKRQAALLNQAAGGGVILWKGGRGMKGGRRWGALGLVLLAAGSVLAAGESRSGSLLWQFATGG